MKAAKRKALEAAGFRIGDAAEFLGLTEEENQLVELRVAVSRAIREQRQKQGLTQQQLATKLKSSQSRVAKIESAANDVSLDLSFRALFAVGGALADLTSQSQHQQEAAKQTSTRRKKASAAKIGRH